MDLRRIGQFLHGDIAASADGERAREAIKAPPELYAQLSFEPAEEVSEVKAPSDWTAMLRPVRYQSCPTPSSSSWPSR